jgi:hypothetical protein
MVATVGVVALGFVLPAASAVASPNNAPSKSTPVSVGVPFSGNWPGTVVAHGSSYNHWWQLPATVRPGDSVELAVDNRASDNTLYFCLVPPVDDFGADQALDGCPAESYIQAGRQDRVQLTYTGVSGQGHLITRLSCCSSVGSVASASFGQYTVVIERIVTKVTPGLVVPAVVPAAFGVGASMVYGDNTPVADGVGARLEWRYQPERGRLPSPYVPLVDTYSTGGSATFNANLPPEAQGRAIQLRACAAQPGGSIAICTADQSTTVEAGGPSPACIAAGAVRKAHSSAVSRLKGKVRRLAAKRAVVRGKAKRRATRQLRKNTRKLRAAKRRLAIAKQNVRATC